MTMSLANQSAFDWLWFHANEFLSFLRTVMDQLWVVVNGHEVPASIVLVLLVMQVGQIVSGERRDLRRLSLGISLTAFVSFGAIHAIDEHTRSSMDLLGILFRAALAGGLAQGLSAILLLPLASVWEHGFQPVVVKFPLRVVRLVFGTRRRVVNEWHRRKHVWQTALREQQQQPAREREQRAQKRLESRKSKDSEKRAAMRYELELIYDRFRSELKDNFPPERFELYFSQYLTDEQDPKVFAQRAEQLKKMIHERVDVKSRNRRPTFQSLDEIIAHFHEQKQQIQSLGLDDDVESLEITLDELQDREIRRFLSP